MKIFKKVILLTLVMVITSCSKDVSFDSPVQAELRGTWIPLLYTYEGHTTITGNESFESQTFSGFGWEMNFQMVFGENPNSYSLIGTYFLDHSVTNDQGQFYILTTYNVIDDQGSWSMNSNDVSVMVDEVTTVMTISELTETSLILRISTTSSEIASDNVTTTETSINEEYVLQRL